MSDQDFDKFTKEKKIQLIREKKNKTVRKLAETTNWCGRIEFHRFRMIHTDVNGNLYYT